jgi:enterochelin esterase-like enzyme
MSVRQRYGTLTSLAFLAALLAGPLRGQETAAPPADAPAAGDSPGEAVESKTTFRLRAPDVKAVRLESSDIPGLPFGGGLAMTKADDGTWSVEVGPLAPGAYRYVFNVDGVRVADPANTSTSESNGHFWSVASVPGSELFDTLDVPHGAVAEVTYQSQSLKRARRMHVYTPPGYEAGADKLPVLYLLHGALDGDASWSTVGRAGAILDNLIAAKKAVPMIVVMPNGHTGPFSFGDFGNINKQIDEFVVDFTTDVRPYVESHYRVQNDRAGRAIAGLSMGGSQTLEISAGNLQDYAYIGVFSSGVFGAPPGSQPSGPTWEEKHATALDDASLKEGLRLVWFATGSEDFLIGTSRSTVETLKKHKFDVEFKETAGGHTWLNWRDYLAEFAPLLFRDAAAPRR